MPPDRLTRRSVGLIPRMPQHVAGETIEPSVSVPIATAQRLAATATPEPELDPDGVRSRAYGLRHCPPRPLQPRSEEHTSELQSRSDLVCRLLLEKKKKKSST